MLASDKLNEVESVFRTPGRINSTWGGNLTDMVRATRYLQVIDEEGLVENARKVGAHLLASLETLRAKHPKTVSNTRGSGLMCAFDMPDGESRKKFLAGARANGVLIVGCGERSVRFRPPLNLTRDDVDEAMAILDRTLGQIGG